MGNDRKVQLDAPVLAFIVDARGVPVCGRAGELELLCRAGYEDLSAGRLLEGHVNALELIGRLGSAPQRESAERDASAGRLFGMWNTQDGDGVHLVPRGDALALRGRKTFASGAGRVARGLITAAWPDGRSQLLLVAMDATRTTIDRTPWRPLGMEASESYAISFDDVVVEGSALIGAPGDYEASPWFLGGAIRFVAVQAGALERLRDETARYLCELGREKSPFQQTRLAEIAVAAAGARSWLAAGAAAWDAFDREPSDVNAEATVSVADLARVDVERAVFAAIERVQRSVGARGLLEPEPFAGLVRDLSMYVRQPAPDAALVRIAERSTRLRGETR